MSVLPVEPKLGKMLILGAIFNCLDPIMTIVAGLSVRDPFLMPADKKDVSLPSCHSKSFIIYLMRGCFSGVAAINLICYNHLLKHK